MTTRTSNIGVLSGGCSIVVRHSNMLAGQVDHPCTLSRHKLWLFCNILLYWWNEWQSIRINQDFSRSIYRQTAWTYMYRPNLNQDKQNMQLYQTA